jgi:hypothetical protein
MIMIESRWLMGFVLALAMWGAAAAPSSAETELRKIVQEMCDAVAPGDVEVWRRYLHDRVIRVDETGAVQTKEDLLKEFSPLPPGLVGRMAVDTFKIETHGDVAVVAYETQEHLDYHGQILRSRFRVGDTWLKTQQGWKLVAEQVAAVLKDPPSIKLTQKQLCEYAEGPDVFFVAGQPRTRRIFVRDAQGKVVGFVDRREGEDIRWNKKGE